VKVLFCTSPQPDYLASCLWDGLQEVLGAENVRDAGHTPDFHSHQMETPNQRLCSSRVGYHATSVEQDVDLMVLNACFTNTFDWHWAWKMQNRLKPGGKIAYVEGWDRADQIQDPNQMSNPPFLVDAVFRREIDPNVAYPYRPYHLDFAAPARWFLTTKQLGMKRDIDVYFAGHCPTHAVRVAMMKEVASLAFRRDLTFVLGNGHPFIPEQHFNLLRRSRIALCPVGVENSSTLRTYEALACGAVPLFIGSPLRVRSGPDYEDGTYGACQHASELLPLIDTLLHLPEVRPCAEGLHTTAARARRLLDITMKQVSL